MFVADLQKRTLESKNLEGTIQQTYLLTYEILIVLVFMICAILDSVSNRFIKTPLNAANFFRRKNYTFKKQYYFTHRQTF